MFHAGEIGNGAGNAQDAGIAAGRVSSRRPPAPARRGPARRVWQRLRVPCLRVRHWCEHYRDRASAPSGRHARRQPARQPPPSLQWAEAERDLRRRPRRPRHGDRSDRAEARRPWPDNRPRSAARASRPGRDRPYGRSDRDSSPRPVATRAGKVTCALARATLTSPVSSGWRSESRTARWNSGSSSRKRMPRWARLTSPGFTRRPPPTSAAIDAE